MYSLMVMVGFVPIWLSLSLYSVNWFSILFGHGAQNDHDAELYGKIVFLLAL